MGDRVRLLGPPLLYMAAIFALSSIPSGTVDQAADPLASVPPLLQNLLHVPLYGGLGWLWTRNLAALGRGAVAAAAAAVLLASAWGAIDEWHQLYVPGRYPSLTDMLFNAAGAGLGAAAGWLWLSRSATRR